MKIAWKSRITSVYFWVGILGVIMTALGVTPELFTSWDMVIVQGKALFGNPFLLCSVVAAIVGVVSSPTKTVSTSDNITDVKEEEK